MGTVANHITAIALRPAEDGPEDAVELLDQLAARLAAVDLNDHRFWEKATPHLVQFINACYVAAAPGQGFLADPHEPAVCLLRHLGHARRQLARCDHTPPSYGLVEGLRTLDERFNHDHVSSA